MSSRNVTAFLLVLDLLGGALGVALLVAYVRPVTDDGFSLGPATWLVIPAFAY